MISFIRNTSSIGVVLKTIWIFGISIVLQNTLRAQELKSEILLEGNGRTPSKNDTLIVHYVLWLENGMKIDSSIDRGRPMVIRLNKSHVIEGWKIALPEMKIGEIRKITVPPKLGYGDDGAHLLIPPQKNLIFFLYLMGIE